MKQQMALREVDVQLLTRRLGSEVRSNPGGIASVLKNRQNQLPAADGEESRMVLEKSIEILKEMTKKRNGRKPATPSTPRWSVVTMA